jgi:hypothetical protein
MPLDHIEHVGVFLTSINGEFNLDHLPLMVWAYLENAKNMIGRVPYHLRWLVVFIKDSHVATMGLNQLWVPSTISKYYMLMAKLLITMVWSRDNSLVDDKPFVNVLGNLHLDLANALEDLISYNPTSTICKQRWWKPCSYPHGVVIHLSTANMESFKKSYKLVI